MLRRIDVAQPARRGQAVRACRLGTVRPAVFPARRLVVPPLGVAEQDVGDVLQEVFSAVANHLDTFRKDRSTDTFRGWLRTITRNKVHDYFRRRASEPSAAGGSEATRQFQQVADQSLSRELLESADDESADQMLFDHLLRKA